MGELTSQEATQKISDLVKQARDLISQAEALADNHGLCFSWDLEYGMGGTYYGEGWDSSTSCEWENSDSENGWVSSSSQC